MCLNDCSESHLTVLPQGEHSILILYVGKERIDALCCKLASRIQTVWNQHSLVQLRSARQHQTSGAFGKVRFPLTIGIEIAKL